MVYISHYINCKVPYHTDVKKTNIYTQADVHANSIISHLSLKLINYNHQTIANNISAIALMAIIN